MNRLVAGITVAAALAATVLIGSSGGVGASDPTGAVPTLDELASTLPAAPLEEWLRRPAGLVATLDEGTSCVVEDGVVTVLSGSLEQTGGSCIGPVTLPAAAPSASTATVTPEWCGGVAQYNRFEMCGISGWRLYETQTVNGQTTVVGTYDFSVTNFTFTDKALTRWVNELQIFSQAQTGTLQGVASLYGSLYCDTCDVVVHDFTTQLAVVGDTINELGEFAVPTPAPGQVAYADTSWVLYVRGNYSTHSLRFTAPQVRCDDALPGNYSPGCVFHMFDPTMTYPFGNDLSTHIAFAQWSGLPGSHRSGVTLERTTDPFIQQQNRDIACPSSSTLPRVDGFQCDEYPFASTYQGAYLSGGGPRTWPQCQILTALPATGPDGYSICMIDGPTNMTGGAQLGAFYGQNRVIDGDSFWTDIVLAGQAL